MHLTAEKQGGSSGSAGKEKKDKQAGEKNKRKGPSVSKDQTQEDKLKTVKEKEEKKREKNPKKKALDERYLNVPGQMSQLNRSIVIVDKLRRDTEGKEKELERKRGELERREKEIQRKERVVQEPNLKERREQEEVQGPSRGGRRRIKMTRSMTRKILVKKIVCFLHLSKLLSVEGRSIIPKLPNETSILVKISIHFLRCYLRHKGQSTRLICSTVFASSRKMNVCIGFEINLVCILSPLVCDSNSMQISLYMILSLSFRS